MPKFSEQRILKSKEVLASFLNTERHDDFLFEEIRNKAISKTQLLLGENDPNYENFFESNLHLLINNSIKMSIPKIRNRFESGYALFRPSESVMKEQDEDFPSFYIFNENEMINYAICRQKMLLEVGDFRRRVIRFYSRISDEFVSKATGLSYQDIQDELEYAISQSNVRFRNDKTYLLYALLNCNKANEFMRYVLNDSNIRVCLLESLNNPMYGVRMEIQKAEMDNKTYYIVPVNEEAEIETMSDDYDIVLINK